MHYDKKQKGILGCPLMHIFEHSRNSNNEDKIKNSFKPFS